MGASNHLDTHDILYRSLDGAPTTQTTVGRGGRAVFRPPTASAATPESHCRRRRNNL